MTASASGDPSVAVVGAGAAGAGVAAAIEDAASVTVLERDGVGGRTATRRRNGCVYDYGANYVTGDDDRVAALLRDLDEGDLVDVATRVWTFDADGEIAPGDEDRADDHRWTFEDGLSTLPARLLERSGATVRTDTAATALERTEESSRWRVRTDGGSVGPVDAVVLTPPGPQTAAILESSPVDDDRFDRAAAAAREVPFRRVHSVALHYPFVLERPYYALVNTDREHAVGWVAREGEKRGHVPDGETLLIAQMSPEWSGRNGDRPVDEAGRDAAGAVARLLADDRLAEPDWIDGELFRFALPDDGAGDAVDALAAENVFAAGDWTVGTGRVHAALASGLRTGDRLAARFES